MITQVFYDDLVKYCKNRIFLKKIQDQITPVDLAHDVITDENFHIGNYKLIVDKYIYEKFKDLKLNVQLLENNDTEFIVEELWRCETCKNDIPKSKFKLSWRDCNTCYREKNKERIKEVNKRSYLKHHDKRKAEKRFADKLKRIENVDEVRAKDREYYKNNKEKILAKNKRSYLKNRDKRLKYLKEYYYKNK